MHTAGAATKTAAIIFLIFMTGMAAILCNHTPGFIIAGIFPGTGYAWQHQQVKTNYEHDRFHNAKIKVSEKIYCYRRNYYLNKVAIAQ